MVYNDRNGNRILKLTTLACHLNNLDKKRECGESLVYRPRDQI